MLLAHQGGWDEGLLVAGPMLAIIGLLWLAKRRAERGATAEDSTPQRTGQLDRDRRSPEQQDRP